MNEISLQSNVELLRKMEFMDTFELCHRITKQKDLNRLPMIRFVLENTSASFEIVNYNQNFLFNECFLHGNDLDLIHYFHKNYFLPFTCGYFAPFINACAQGNIDLIRYLIKVQAYSWKTKYFKPLRNLILGNHFALIFELVECQSLPVEHLSFDNEFFFRHLCQEGNIFFLQRLIEVHSNLNYFAQNHSALEKVIKTGSHELFVLLYKKYSPFVISNLVLKNNFNLLRLAAQGGNVEIFQTLELHAESYTNVLLLVQLCKKAIIFGHLDIIKHIVAKYNIYFHFEAHIIDFMQLKCREDTALEIIKFFDSQKKFGQEIYVESFYTSLNSNKMSIAKFCYECMDETNREFLVDEFVISGIYYKLSVEFKNWLNETFAEAQKYYDENHHRYFSNLITKNDLEQAKIHYRQEYFERLNHPTYIEIACFNNNVEMVEWILCFQEPNFFISLNTVSKVCENGNVEILKKIMKYTLISEIQKGFIVACSCNQLGVVKYIYENYASFIDLEESLRESFHTMIAIDNMDIIYWISGKIDFKNFLKKYYKEPKEIYLILEGICSGQSDALFRWFLKYVTLNSTIVGFLIKWCAKYNRENNLLYLLEICHLYDVDANIILRNCLQHKSYLVLYTDFYTKNKFNPNTIRVCLENIIHDEFIFKKLFRDFVLLDAKLVGGIALSESGDFDVLELLYDYLEKSKLDSCLYIFENMSRLEQYKALKKLCHYSFVDTFIDYYDFIVNVVDKNPLFKETIVIDTESKRILFTDILSFYVEINEHEKILPYLLKSIEVFEKESNADMCFICGEKEQEVKAKCSHMYCLNCFIEYTLKYDNENCAMCRRKINYDKLLLSEKVSRVLTQNITQIFW